MAQEYYDSDDIGALYGLPGTGIIGLMLGDQLHPPMVNDEDIWKEGKNWKKGAVQCTLRLADLADISESDVILDIGCGIGGPAILLTENYGCKVIGLNPSKLQLKTARKRSAEKNLTDRISYLEGRAESIPLHSASVDCTWSFNMFYHVAEKERAVEEFHRVLKEGGRLAFDDWFITNKADTDDIKELQYHWVSPPWITDSELKEIIESKGFRIESWNDYTDIGKGVMKKYFTQVFERDYEPEISAINERGEQMAYHFKTAVKHTIDLYSGGKISYAQFVAIRA